mmetsp:Transcript_1807/g.3872  ORF Transcript_1807/g.3872 Transcript_1807/m.3872 type:complete len:107 (-) Transcript_1807:23-343(-)
MKRNVSVYRDYAFDVKTFTVSFHIEKHRSRVIFILWKILTIFAAAITTFLEHGRSGTVRGNLSYDVFRFRMFSIFLYSLCTSAMGNMSDYRLIELGSAILNTPDLE